MPSAVLSRDSAGFARGRLAERRAEAPSGLDGAVHALACYGRALLPARGARQLARILPSVEASGRRMGQLDDEALALLAPEVGRRLRREGLRHAPAMAEAFALVREVASRRIGLRPRDTQVMAAWAMASGLIAEMATGEGKSLAAPIVAAAAALAGCPVHVVTVNDYLAGRDARTMAPLFAGLGLTCRAVEEGQDLAARRHAYAADVVYCTNKDLVFDYLRDRIAVGTGRGPLGLQAETLYSDAARLGRTRLRGLHFAVVDEADSVLVDEARMPLVISAATPGGVSASLAALALATAEGLRPGEGFVLDAPAGRVQLTDPGRRALEEAAGESSEPQWGNRLEREDLVTRALTALHLLRRGVHYVLLDGKVAIVDEGTGRAMPDRSWSDGLQQLVETKEGVGLSPGQESLAQITYQAFFRRYVHLCGMTGTTGGIRAELLRVYGLTFARIPLHKPLRRVAPPPRVFATRRERTEALVRRIGALQGAGVPVLAGTASVAAARDLSARLSDAGIAHAVLDAEHAHAEAETIAGAGQPGRVTVATAMAGRGTDIALAEGVAEAGGLHVLLTERHAARRIDDQLAGRSARRGEPGAVESFLSLEDDLLSGTWRLPARIAAQLPGLMRDRAGSALLRAAQAWREWGHHRERMAVLRADERRRQHLAFAGRPE